MKVLFVMRNTSYARNFESTLTGLAAHAHAVHIVADRIANLPEANAMVERLCREYPSLHYTEPPANAFNPASYLGLEVRRGIDYLRYLGPRFAQAHKLRERSQRRAHPLLLRALRYRLVASPAGRRLMATLLHWIDAALERNPAIDEFVRQQDPDVVLVTPLVEPGSPQSDYLRSARSLGIRTALCVYSWDNLTNKGLIHDPLDLITVWNQPMRDEAVTLHGVPAARVEITGAPGYDHWFRWRPSSSRDEFCARVGLPPDRPFFLYLCSSRFIAPDEVAYIRRWVTELRALSPALREAGVLVRPHPQHMEQWSTADFGDLERVAVWPQGGASPLDTDSRAEYFDSIHHSAAVVGVNTSGLIESAIIGRPVYTVLAPEFRDTQAGTLHFHHLRQENGGVLHLAESMSEHASQLEAALRQGGDDGRGRRFVEAFVRPHGVDVEATPHLVAAIERVASLGRARPDTGPWFAPLIRPALRRAAARLAKAESGDRENADRLKREMLKKYAKGTSERALAKEAKRQRDAERTRHKAEVLARRVAERQTREAADAKSYQDYLAVREWARRFRSGEGHEPGLSPAEQRALTQLEHLWNATPETISTLRHQCAPITGVRVGDYDSSGSEPVLRARTDLAFLRREHGDDLFIQESPRLGGFGFVRRGERYNEDTIRYFKTLAALQDGGVLSSFRQAGSRRIVWEIGGGWGGFAYQFKTVCPDVTYLITGHAEMLLVSAVYLMAVFPAARCRFYDDAAPAAMWRDWEQVDFVFAPERALASLQPPRLDLTLELNALCDMSDERARRHVQRAFQLGSPYFHSMLPAPGTADVRDHVWKTVERLYWPQPIPPRMTAQSYAAFLAGTRPDTDDLHLVGWKRLHV